MNTSATNLATPLTITQLIQGYRSGAINLSSFLHQQLEIARKDTSNAWISCLSEHQLDDYIAKLEGQDINELPLYGVPFAIKDNIDLSGLDTSAACEAYRYQPQESAYVVARLIAAGAVPLGKTNLDQFATGLVGTRSPYGAVKNSFDPEYISGGSSSGSAVTVATNQVLFSLGTETAGSGRVPAAFNNLYGLKATKGMLSCRGVVPACRSLDCVTLFSKSADDLALLYQIAADYDEGDCYSRQAPERHSQMKLLAGLKVGVPSSEQLAFFGDQAYADLYQASAAQLAELGAELVPFDLAPFLDAATLLYHGPWVAERYAAIENFYQQQPEQCLDVIQTIIGGAAGLSASDTFKAMYKMQAFKQQCDRLMAKIDMVLTPTAGSIYTIEQLENDPISLNTNLGYYTNFMNLLDYSAIAIPAGFTEQGLPFGVTLFSKAFADNDLLAIAREWQQAIGLPLGATGRMDVDYTDVMVCGAHMQGLPLNHQLTALGGHLKLQTTTAEGYRLYSLAGDPPARPGLVRDEQNGSTIEVEVWRVPTTNLGALLIQIPHPLGLGKVELASGQWVTGFICEPIATQVAQEITHLGGWRHYLAEQLQLAS